MPFHGCSKLLKACAVFYWGTHTRFMVSVGIDPSLTKTRRTRGADCIIMVLYGKLYITRIRASYTWQYLKRNILLRFYGISHACANSGARALPRKKRPGNEASLISSARIHQVSTIFRSHSAPDRECETGTCTQVPCHTILCIRPLFHVSGPQVCSLLIWAGGGHYSLS